MFVEVNGSYINAVYMSSLKKDTSDGYKLIYNMSSGGSFEEEFTSQKDLDDKFEATSHAMSGGGSAGMKYEVVQELPETGEEGTIYLVPKSTSGTSNYYDEYMYINNAWEKIGDTEIDLSGYQTLIDSNHKLSADLIDDSNSNNKLVTSTEKSTWNGKQDALVSETNIKSVNGNSLLGSGNLSISPIIEASESNYPQSRPLNISELPLGTILTFPGSAIGNAYVTSTDGQGTTAYAKQIYRGSNAVALILIEKYIYNALAEYDFVSFTGFDRSPESSSNYGKGFIYRYYVSQSSMNINDSSAQYIFIKDPVGDHNNGSTYIKGTFTFQNHLPESSLVPTTDDQLVNKKYVDDTISDSITTALGGNY